MAKIEETLPVSDRSPSEIYDAAKAAYPKAGWQIWKERQIAWLLLAKRNEGGVEMDSNVSARYGSPAQMTVIVSCDHMDEGQIRPLFDRLLAEIKTALG